MNPRPSSAHQWVYCPGSVALQEKYPDQKDNSDAMDGIAAHKKAAAILTLNPCDITLPDEYNEAVGIYVDHIRSVAGNRVRYVEYSVNVFPVHARCNGILDAAWYDSKNDMLHIWDLKCGRSFVDAVENWAMILYAIGLGAQIQYGNVTIWIVQPRGFYGDPIRSWTITRNDLAPYQQRLRAAADLIDDPNAPVLTGRHCRYCSALVNCPSAGLATSYAIDVAGSSAGVEFTPEQLGVKYVMLCRAKEMIEHMAESTKAGIIQLIKSGGVVPGWQVTHSPGRVKWIPGMEEQAKAMAELMGVNITKEELITPTQSIKAGIPEEVVSMYAQRYGGGENLKPVNIDKFKEIFKK